MPFLATHYTVDLLSTKACFEALGPYSGSEIKRGLWALDKELMVTSGKDGHVHTAVFKMDNQQGPSL